jgi:GNAT superfamily N-acetyltransferase
MDPLLKAFGSKWFPNRDTAIRYVEERDIPAFADLFKSNYGDGYLARDVYDGSWIKRSLYSDNVICLVLVEEEKVLATGSVILDYGDHNDKSAELARLAVHPVYARHGLGHRVIDALFKVAENSAEFAIAEARTVHDHAQDMMEMAFFPHIGFVPQLLHVVGKRESLALYAKLYSNGEFLRSATPPVVIPEVAPLAHFVLAGMKLKDEIEVVDAPIIKDDPSKYVVCPLEREHVAHLLKIPNGRVTDPLLFSNISLEQGYAFVRDKAKYLVALDSRQNPVGAIGYHFDENNQLVKGLELIASHNDVWPSLCRALIREAESLKAEVIPVDVSAYQPQLQRLLFSYGFRPVAYAPAMVFTGTERLDVIKMIKLNVPYAPGELSLTPGSREVVALIEANFH